MCVCLCSHGRRFAHFTEEGREMARGTLPYLPYPEEAQTVRNGGDIIFVFSLFLNFLLVCLKRRAENKIDNNGYQFQETYYLNRN